MKLYKLKSGAAIESPRGIHVLNGGSWDSLVNDDRLLAKLEALARTIEPRLDGRAFLDGNLAAPIGSQELWASGVTYRRSMVGRQAESRAAGGGDFYARVYEAERPELFFKAGAHRIAGPGGTVRIRRDSTWNVPEPELTLMITSSGRIVGCTIGNDMSSRSIEGENPLYLPQAKTYDGCAALGPCLYVADQPPAGDTRIELEILRQGATAAAGEVEIRQMKRTPQELVDYLYRECSFPYGALLMTGTGIVPPGDFTLLRGDEIRITMEPIGTLINTVQ